MLIYLTGVPGSGKSAVCDALRARGIPALDGDAGLCAWHRKVSGEFVGLPPSDATPDWYAEHAWLLHRDRLAELLASPDDDVVFVGAWAEREDGIDPLAAVHDLFAGVVYLDISEPVLRERLATRANPFGKNAEQLASVLRWRDTARVEYEQAGAVIVDADEPLAEVVTRVVAASHHLRETTLGERRGA